MQKSDCSYAEIINALGLNENLKDIGASRLLLREHNYLNAEGVIIARKMFYKVGNTKKNFWERNENDKFVNGLGKMEIPIYNLPSIINASNQVLYIVEGEKDVDTLNKLGYLATTSPNSAAGLWNSDYNKYFADKNVVIIPANDAIGAKYAEKIVSALLETAKSIKVIDLVKFVPTLAIKGDISDVYNLLGENKTKEIISKAIKGTEEIKSSKAPNWLKALNGKNYIEKAASGWQLF